MCLVSQPVGNMGGNSYLYLVNESNLPAMLRYERTDYAKAIRKDYEKGIIKERMCNLRSAGLRQDGIANTLTTVEKDTYICVDILNNKEMGNE